MRCKLFRARSLSALALVGRTSLVGRTTLVGRAALAVGATLAISAALATDASAQEIRAGGAAKTGSADQSASATAKASDPEKATTTSSAPKSAATETPRDPRGVTGISPFWESINKGDAAFLAQDFEGASTLYQAAIQAEPKNSVGHLRMAELSLKQGELDRAEEFVTAALRFSSDVRTKAQGSFLMAEAKERRPAPDEALTAWQTYKAIEGQLPANAKAPARGPLPAVVYVETADQRAAAIEAKKKLDEEYAAVRERIQKNIDAADEATGGKKADEKSAE